ncbi:phage major capsid protein [Diaphorobacter sp.]|uniref:phage major capsid protein n=1 Tax=Diaphorobacter sp. TaxID=1934310 RepID=UPI0028A7E30B|nr:phage major capsid protein [Diaphorobacter sp.]
MQLNEIREAKARKVTEARTLLGAGDMTPEKATAFDKLKGEITALEADESRAQFVDDLERRTQGQPVDKSQRELEQSVSVGDAIRAQIEQRALTGALAEFNAEQVRQGNAPKRGGVLVPSSIFEKRTTMETPANTAIKPDDYRPQEMIGLLRNSAIVRSLGARVLTGCRGDVVLPKQTGASSATWIAEGESLTESNPTFANIKLTPKHVGALASYSRQLLIQANPSIDQLLRDDFVQIIGLAVDKALLHGLAANDEPVGILNTTGIQTASLATLNWAAIVAMLEKLGLSNVMPSAFVTHAKAATKLQTTLKASSAGSAFLMESGRMADLPVSVTNQLDAKGTTTQTGRVLAGDFSQLVIAEFSTAEIVANPFGAGFDKGEVQIRILQSLDAAVRHPGAFVLADDLAL